MVSGIEPGSATCLLLSPGPMFYVPKSLLIYHILSSVLPPLPFNVFFSFAIYLMKNLAPCSGRDSHCMQTASATVQWCYTFPANWQWHPKVWYMMWVQSLWPHDKTSLFLWSQQYGYSRPMSSHSRFKIPSVMSFSYNVWNVFLPLLGSPEHGNNQDHLGTHSTGH